MLRTSTVALAIATTMSLQVEHPSTVTTEAARAVPIAGQAGRIHMMGLVETYSVAIYADGSLRNRERLVSADAPKAVRIAVTYTDDPYRRAILDWRLELVPPLEPRAVAHLNGAFAALREGDVVLAEYAPGKGTTVRVNKAVIVSGASHELMLSFLDHWIGQRPLSEEMKQSLLGSS